MGFIKKSIGGRLVTFFLLLVLIPLGLVGYLSYRSGRQSIIANVKSQLESIAILKAHQIENWTNHLQHTLVWLTQSPTVIKNADALAAYKTSDPSYASAYNSLATELNRIATMEHLAPVFLMDKKNGQIIASSNNSWEGKFRDNEPYFSHAKNGFYVSEIFLSLPLGRPTMVIVGPIKDSQGNIVAILAAHANLNYLSKVMLERSGLGKTAETFLVNRSNLLVTNTVFAPDGAFKKWIFGQGAKWALQGKSGVALFEDYRGVAVIGAYRWLGQRKLALIAKQDQKEALSSITTLRNTIISLAIIVAFLTIISGLLISRTITIPLRRIMMGAVAIGGGNFDYRVGTTAIDEIGILSRAFDQMAKNLKAITVSRDALAREIAGREKAEKELINSEAFLNSIIDQSPYAMWISNATGMLIRLNKACCDLLHITEAEVVGEYNILGDNVVKTQGLMPLVEGVYDQGRPANFRIAYDSSQLKHLKLKKATYVVLDTAIFPIKDGSGRVTNAVIQHVNVTDRIEAENARRESEAHLQAIMDHSPALISIIDLGGKIILANHTFEALNAPRPDALIGKNVSELFTHEIPGSLWEKDIATLETGHPIEIEEAIRHKDGSWHVYLTNKFRIRDTRGHPMGTCTISHDITERKETEAHQRQQQKLEAIGTLAGGVAHEINNPINGIMNYAQLILDEIGRDDPLSKHALEIIHETERVATIVRNLLTFARTDKEHYSPAQISDIIDAVMSLTRSIVNRDQITVKVAIDKNLPKIKCRSQQIQQVVMNLVTNARDTLNLKYPAYDKNKKIKITAAIMEKNNTRWIRTIVKDNGTGISAETIERMFDPFFSTKPKEQGTGLGLSISYGIVKEHQGQLSIKSVYGQYTKFFLDLPVADEKELKTGTSPELLL